MQDCWKCKSKMICWTFDILNGLLGKIIVLTRKRDSFGNDSKGLEFMFIRITKKFEFRTVKDWERLSLSRGDSEELTKFEYFQQEYDPKVKEWK